MMGRQADCLGCLLFVLLLMVESLLAYTVVDGECTNQYRTLNGSCTNVYRPAWGRAGQLISESLVPSSRASPLSSQILAEEPDRLEPVTEWLGAWTGFIKADLLRTVNSPDGVLNAETPTLDLSLLYGTKGTNVKVLDKPKDDSLETGERVLWSLLKAEHTRLTNKLAALNAGWGPVKISQEARKILIGEYQSIIVNEVLPLLLGVNSEEFQDWTNNTSTETVTPEDLLTSLHANLAMGSSELSAPTNLIMQRWPILAEKMLGLRLIIPGGGITMDRLSEVSDAADMLGHIQHKTWAQVRQECDLPRDEKFVEAIIRADLELANIDPVLGGLAEEPVLGGILSPTLECLFRRVIKKVILGDGFWYTQKPENSADSSVVTKGFSDSQIASLNTVTLAGLLCANLPMVDDATYSDSDKPPLLSIQPAAFLLPDQTLNHVLACADLPGLDLALWQTEETHLAPDEEEEVRIAIAVAADNLIAFRQYEYSLYERNFVAPFGSGGRALGSVSRPSVPVQNAINNSALFELVTYEFLRRPNLASVIEAVPSRSNSRSKRSPRTFNIFHDVVDTSSSSTSFVFDNLVRRKINTLPHENTVYRTVSTKNTIFHTPTKIVPTTTINLGVPLTPPPPPPPTTNTPTDKSTCTPSESKRDCSFYLRYRSYSGYCNNLGHPAWGMAGSPHRRFLAAEYDDNVAKPRTRSSRRRNQLSQPLPNARRVSSVIHTNELIQDAKYTLMLMQWGQFIDHDLTHTPMTRGFHESVLQCGSCASRDVHPACFPINIPEDDPFFAYNPVNPKCIPFARSVAGQQHLGPREQINQLTSYLDASMIYGSDECKLGQLVQQGTYLLKSTTHPLNKLNTGRSGKSHYKDMLPMITDHPECFSARGECFDAGDSRVNEQPGLTCLHTLFIRQHNSVATQLSALNPHWDTNRVFEETRRIVAAQVQHITYNEFLPRVVGRNNLKAFGLELVTSDDGYYHDYDSECAATSFNEFATAAFRFGHSTIRSNLTVMSEDAMMGRTDPHYISLHHHFNNPDIFLTVDMVDDLTRGLIMTPMEAMDNKVTVSIANHLFEQRGKPKSGMDLIALNIQRGRDHGIPGYNKYREMCKLKRANTFLDFKDEISFDLIYKLQRIYKHPDDVDLFPGLLAETRLKGALTGPTLACLIGLQFSHIRKCDRFWYESGDPQVRFSPQQLREIRSTSLAGITCENMDKSVMIPRSALDQMDRLTNPMVNCKKTVKHLNLQHWKEKKSVSRVSTCQIESKSILLGEWLRVSPCTSCNCTSQGQKCETVNLYQSGSSCLKLVEQWGIKAVEEDESCKKQCRIL